MSLLEELESRGVTAEDLEKAASVRLFEKAAAAEGVDLDSLDVDQVEELYAAFLSNPSYDDNTPTKEASAMNDEIVDLFEKTAASEGIDLDDMADAELAELYNHYVDNVLPLQIEEYEKEASYDEVDEATEKLAEAEILGRHMARAYMDEMGKEAEQPKQIEQKSRMGARLKELATGHQAASERAAKKIQERGGTLGVTAAERAQLAKEMGQAQKGQRSSKHIAGRTTRINLSEGAQRTANRLKAQRGVIRAERLKGYGKRGLAVGAAGAAAYGAKKMMSKKSSADDLYEIAYDRAEEFAKVGSVEDYDGSFIDDMACDILGEHGYYLVD